MTDRNSSTAGFLDRDASDSYLQEWTRHIAAEKTIVGVGVKSIFIFRLGVEWLALPTTALQEVGRTTVVRKLPERRGGILKGLVSVRGELLLCVALEPLLGIDSNVSSEPKGAGKMVITGSGPGRFAFWVDEAEGVSRYDPNDLRPVPATLSRSAAGAYILGVLPMKDRTVGCLDDELLFYALNKGLA